MKHSILILGGTAEARKLAERLSGDPRYRLELSLAGRTLVPAEHAVPLRVGGFGGAEGLADYLRENGIAMLIDATHPYAAQISANAAAASRLSGVPLLALRRAPWQHQPGDRWRQVASVAVAVSALGETPRRVFLTLGRQELLPFEAAPQHDYLIRSVDPVEPPLSVPHAAYITDRGPFEEAQEAALLSGHGIEVIVAKNSGGPASYGKIAAARALGIDVVLIERPELPDVEAVGSVDEMVERLAHALPPL
ncbi:cobalt-precorrin-6A reductase [Pseudorhizobium pelagicum]|uniref:Cobalt-precorrin-6X reductase n=1 Tax=Pseudorhizobium pelagicum TaxID=1509405 RepID=A0A922T6Y8_9HYPH|nr:cobalt-precorrin-6A reductase [Pseudorhizobium pelagicum]KEQ03377.1 cobalt-precorrin-6X reductase [Pseudorhizobium pelagicum]KEQ08527.1 cobalt-precorrin-6X reductase [Pseudorhizobium pelagicum]